MAPRDPSTPEHPSGLPPELLAAPPWILGHRGAPLEAPENTISSIERALALGLDGVEYDLQSCLEGEPILLHDDTFERTAADARAAEEVPLAELAALEVGGWFGKRFAGEPVPLLADALGRRLTATGEPALHMIELKRSDLVGRVVEDLAELDRPMPVRIASFHRDVCLAARDAGLPSMLLAVHASDEDLAWLARERIEAYGLGPGAWEEVSRAPSRLERWGWSIDRPDHLLHACRTPFFGFNTNEPRRALAARALVRLAPDDVGGWPLEVPELEVHPEGEGGGRWAGRWTVRAAVRNPFPYRVAVELSLEVRRGAFETSDMPGPLALEVDERREFAFSLAGGSYSPGLDPLVVARFLLPEVGDDVAALTIDAPLVRIRRAVLRSTATRLVFLAEGPRAEAASVRATRRANRLVVEIENAAGLLDAHVSVSLDGAVRHGTHGVRVVLPEDFDGRPGGVPFSVAIAGRDPTSGRLTWRRWAGGLPSDLLSGSPGRLLAGARA